jgi:hypothetical protein
MVEKRAGEKVEQEVAKLAAEMVASWAASKVA